MTDTLLKIEEVTKVKKLFDYMVWDLKLSRSKAFKVIFNAKEYLSLFENNYEQCQKCKNIYSSHHEGYHCEKCEKYLCDDCLCQCSRD